MPRQERINEQPQDYLAPNDLQPGMSDVLKIIPSALPGYLLSIKGGRRRSPIESLFHLVNQRPDSLPEYVYEGLKYDRSLEYANRYANEYYRLVTDQATNGEAGKKISEMFEDSKLADHGWSHIRLVKRTFLYGVYNSEAIRHTPGNKH